MDIQRKTPSGGNRKGACKFRLSNHNKSFAEINALALSMLPSLLARWLPDGKLQGREYVAHNPKRADQNIGSFSINTHSGRWCDFATGDAGGDVISLAAYLSGKKQREAADELARMMGVKYV